MDFEASPWADVGLPCTLDVTSIGSCSKAPASFALSELGQESVCEDEEGLAANPETLGTSLSS